MPALLLAILVALLLAPSAQAAPREVPEGFMGVMADGPLVDQGITDISREGALMQQNGVEAIRIVVYWADLQPTRDGPIDWASTDRVVAMAAANHLRSSPSSSALPHGTARTRRRSPRPRAATRPTRRS